MTLFHGPCCFPCGFCFDPTGYCWSFQISGVSGNPYAIPACNDNAEYSSCPDYNGTWLLVAIQSEPCTYYVCRPAVCCFSDYGPPFNGATGARTGWMWTMQQSNSLNKNAPFAWTLENDCGEVVYTLVGGLINGPNTFTLTSQPAFCQGWPQTIQLTPIPPRYDALGNLIPCDTCCACPNPWPAYKFTMPDRPGGCNSAGNPQPQPNAACTCGEIFGQTYEMQFISLTSAAPWVCVYGVTVGEWSFDLIIQDIGPDSRTVSLTGSLSGDCNYPGIVSSGQLLKWTQTYTSLGLAAQPCAGSYTLPMAGFGDGLGCYCEGFGQGPSITVGAVTG